jgi:hypothetical protein
MLMGSLAAFTLVALLGVVMLFKVWCGGYLDTALTRLHAAAALVGSGLAIAAALGGDERIYLNIGMAVAIMVLGVIIAIRRHKTGKAPKGLLLLHGGLAVGCYAALAFFVFNPGVALI